ncbi:flavin-containing monooxygenase [Aspergillus lucknowensis]|uniref:Cyclohexanone monooxygenase n=1 Tax=Aspergillus lucknowensis TaxID=176173 RepID=A0ABR4LA02_9EURO
MSPPFYDVLVVGAGFGGINQLYTLLKFGLTVKVVDKAGGPGGTWYWNRYPGAMSDTTSALYRFPWDKEDLLTYPWTHNYLEAKEILAYLEHFVDRHDLRKHMQFDTEVLAATWSEDDYTWRVETSQGVFTARYFITALGVLSDPNWPNIPGRETFHGDILHTARWPEKCDLKGKRVAVVGNGSTGVQVITTIAPEVGSLLSFQRRPLYTVPAGKRPVTKEDRARINETWDEVWQQVRDSIGGVGVDENKPKATDVSPEEIERVFQEAWDEGGGFRFILGTFSDLMMNEAANRAACDFLRAKIAQIVRDPEKRRKLTPTTLYNRRPISDTGYYETFNRGNVDVVDTANNAIVEVTSDGLKLADGMVYQLDVIIFATGYDAFDGPYKRMNIVGRDGLTLREHWRNGPSANVAAATAGFPNLFMINGPTVPLANIPPVIEATVDFITRAISHVEELRRQKQHRVAMVPTPEGDTAWIDFCNMVSDAMLFKTAPSYFYGANVEGKAQTAYIFFGGLGLFRQKLKECEDSGYASYTFIEPSE